MWGDRGFSWGQRTAPGLHQQQQSPLGRVDVLDGDREWKQCQTATNTKRQYPQGPLFGHANFLLSLLLLLLQPFDFQQPLSKWAEYICLASAAASSPHQAKNKCFALGREKRHGELAQPWVLARLLLWSGPDRRLQDDTTRTAAGLNPYMYVSFVPFQSAASPGKWLQFKKTIGKQHWRNTEVQKELFRETQMSNRIILPQHLWAL